MTKYMIEENVLKQTLDYIPPMLWDLFEEEGPIIIREGTKISSPYVGASSYVVFSFDDFELQLPADVVTEMETDDD